MPTKHRQEMIDAGYALPRQHSPKAVAVMAALEEADQAKLDAAAKAAEEAQKNADRETEAKRAEQDARHKAELAAMYPRKKKG